jgi:hypothetical protein
MNREKDTTVKERDTSGQGYRRTGTRTQMDGQRYRDIDGHEEGHRRTGRETETQRDMERDRDKGGQRQEQRQA